MAVTTDISSHTSHRDFASEAAAVAGAVAAAADAVDKDARFPAEAIEALRASRLLGAMIRPELGGGGATISEIGRVIETLGSMCASTAMVYAMHQIQVACLVHHGHTPELLDYTRKVAAEELLLASATTEIGVGGDVRTSLCAIERHDNGRYSLTKEASVISYGQYADAILATARRDPDAANSDQVIVVVPAAERTLEQRGSWDTLGFRGTCSLGFLLKANGPVSNVIPVPYADVSAQTMLPTSHVTWGHVWLGIAEGAMAKARTYVRAAARKAPGVTPPGALRLAEAMAVLHQFRALVHGAARDYEDALTDPTRLTSMGFAIQMNNLKLSSSTLVVDIVGRAMQICGISGYREDSPYSLSRSLRDAHGAALMVNNDRIYGTTAQMLLIAKEV